MVFATAAIAEEEEVDREDQVAEAVVVAEALDREHLQIVMIHRLLPLLIALIVQLIPGQGAKNNSKVSKNQKWVSFDFLFLRQIIMHIYVFLKDIACVYVCVYMKRKINMVEYLLT